jgi:Protein of unknown function (DUF1566)
MSSITSQSARTTDISEERVSNALYELRLVRREKLSKAEVHQMLTRYGFYSASRFPAKKFANPEGKGIKHDYQKMSTGQLVLDRATGLMWQRSGSGVLSHPKALAYIDELNRNELAGYRDWRLPTLEEAMCLMEPEKKHGELHIDPVFDGAQQVLRTADQPSWAMSWMVFLPQGYCLPQSSDSKACVRAVRSSVSS